ncbi:cytochrome c oxidase subunit II [Telmatospirillum sp. J64-1]|uniref:cytochrome c oxidase subunit II n=1 Tax=Telmatospirillum sp. J64-1 TaxID=2502183 RepID=UPI00115CE31A|nr:cytochrome c oxidase subunit II [Telmatospirillum sp. J64-1]
MNATKVFMLAAFLAASILAMPDTAMADGFPVPWQMGMQEPASPTMERISQLNNLLNVIVLGIVLLVMALVGYAVWRFRASRNPEPAKWSHNTVLEIAWTTVPVLLLLAIAVPSFRLLYFMDRTEEADMTLKVTGHQWYWSYEYPDYEIGFDAIMVPDEELQPDQLRQLTTDNVVVLPTDTNIRIHLTASDVIHSWGIPSLGLKTDTVPGRLNETWVRITRPGTFYGQCYELCGINHAFMPIMIRAVPPEEFQAWLEEAQEQFALNKKPDGPQIARAETSQQ